MELKNAIVHFLQKDRHAQPQLRLRNSLLQIDQNLIDLVISLRKLYSGNTGRGYGCFHEDIVNYPFSGLLRGYVDTQSEFVNFTHVSMATLQSKIASSQLATGGYILFAEYLEGGRSYLIVASIKHRPGLAFDQDLNLTGSIQLDLNKLHEMARVDITTWLDSGERYLSFAKRRMNEDGFSDYFQEFIGCSEIANSSEMTRLVLRAVKEFGVNQNLDQDGHSNLRSIAFNYFEERNAAQEPVSLIMLSQRINENEPEAFLQFINDRQDDYPISDGFEPIKSVYKQLKTFQMKDRNVKVQFDQESFGTRVILTADGTLIIRDLKQDFIRELREFQNA